MTNHWLNIEGCLSKYRDIRTTDTWLTRAKLELSAADFSNLIDKLMDFLIENHAFSDLSESIIQILNKHDPSGDGYRRSRLDQQHKLILEQEVLRKKKEREARKIARLEEQRLKEVRREAEERDKLEKILAERRKVFQNRINGTFGLDFLNADRIYKDDPDVELIDIGQYKRLKTEFVQHWASHELQLNLDLEQAAAVAATDGDIQVVARAGSGKTRTLITRAIFLQKHCRIAPHELLLLAFNRKAATEMKRRLAKAIDGKLPHVMTFHALAHALVHPEEELLFDDANVGQLGLSREVQEVIDEHVRSEEHHDRIRDLMIAQFKDDWERIVDGRIELTMDEFLAHRRELPRESLKGDYVKSFGERLIANTLFEHGVEYRYERNFRWSGYNYRPDFTIPIAPQGGVIIEYFGLQGDADYDKASDKKRAFWAEREEWKFLEFSPMDIAQQGIEAFSETLTQELRKVGIPCQRLSEEKLWELIRRRALDSFTAAMRIFVGRCRKLNLSVDDLSRITTAHIPCTTAETLFLNVGISVYKGYLNCLADNQKEDFDGLMWRSTKLIHDGQTRFVRDQGRERGDVGTLRFVMIDEFQDFSQMFLELINAIRLINPHAQYFCVGDDWQAINAFAGSDLSYFEGFTHYFHQSSKYYIRTNYRSPKEIVETGNALMSGLGEPAQAYRTDKGWVRLCNLASFKPSAPEQARHNGDEITPALLRLVRSQLDLGLDVVMLSRRNSVPWYINYDDTLMRIPDALSRFLAHIRSHLPEDDQGRVTISTAHRYKGLENGTVIVLDAIDRSYPLIHPNWVFLRVFGDTLDRIVSEERRLFYVAITRAENSLALLTDTPALSPYIRDIHSRFPIESLTWEDLPPTPSMKSPHLEIRVFDAFDVKDLLKDLNYKWNDTEKYWRRAVMAEGFSFDSLLQQPWVRDGIRIEVYSETVELLHQR